MEIVLYSCTTEITETLALKWEDYAYKSHDESHLHLKRLVFLLIMHASKLRT